MYSGNLEEEKDGGGLAFVGRWSNKNGSGSVVNVISGAKNKRCGDDVI